VERAAVVAAASGVLGRVGGRVGLFLGGGQVLDHVELDGPAFDVDVGEERRMASVGHDGCGVGVGVWFG
jgi:hypothetical protein